MAYHRTTYTIGFMGWYDTYKNTKINYYLLPLGLGLGPLIYLYIRTTVSAPFQLLRKDLWHFIPVSLFVIYKIIVLLHDCQQPGWDTGYSGEWKDIDEQYVGPITNQLSYTSQVIYLAFTAQLFWIYRSKINRFFSNTYRVELNWIRNFLLVYISLFVYGSLTDAIDAFIIDLDYVHRWWVHLFSAIAIVYLGIKAYFTDLDGLHGLTFGIGQTYSSEATVDDSSYVREHAKIATFLEEHEAFLNPDLTLKDLAAGTGLTIHGVSEAINNGLGKNFNELINHYRVDRVKKELLDPNNEHLSLVAIAYDCGFNSKATFNRVFKKYTGVSPSQYKASSQSSNV